MSKWNVGDIPQRTADEDMDRDVEIAEEMERKIAAAKGKSARQRIEELKEDRG